MGDFSPKGVQLIEELVRTLPVDSLLKLNDLLSRVHNAELGIVRNVVARQLESHHLKEQVFRPFVPLFRANEGVIEGVRFPQWILNRLWAALEHQEPQLIHQARLLSRGLRVSDPVPVPYFRLVTSAAVLLREQSETVMQVDGGCAELPELAAYLDLHRLLRRAVARLPSWMGRIDAETATAIRLMFKDAASKASDDAGGVRFLEALQANLDDATQILKLVAIISEDANDRFLSESELSVFGERVLRAAEEQFKMVECLLRRRDPSVLANAGCCVLRCLSLLGSLQKSVKLSRTGPWGKRAFAIYQSVNGLVEDRMKDLETIISSALPLKTERIFGRATREVPDYARIKSAHIEAALQTLAFINQVRPAAAQAGYSSLLTRTVAAAERQMDNYFDVVLKVAVADDPFDASAVMACFEQVIALMEGLLGEQKSSVARRRAVSANVFRAPKTDG